MLTTKLWVYDFLVLSVLILCSRNFDFSSSRHEIIRALLHEMSASDASVMLTCRNVQVSCTLLGEILVAHRISVFGQIARLERVMFLRTWCSADTLICQLVILLVPIGDDALVDPHSMDRPDLIGFE